MRNLLTALSFCVVVTAAGQEPAKDTAADQLPKGAIARLGTERMKNLDGYGTARIHPDGKQVIAVAGGRTVLLDPATGNEIGPFAKGTVRGMTHLSADGSRAVGTSFNGFVVWSCETGETVYELKRTLGYDDSLSLSGDGKRLAVGGRADEKDKKKPVAVTVYDVDGQKELASLTVAQNQSARMVLSGDGKRGVSWGYHYEQAKPGEEPDEDKNPSKLLQFWDVEAKKELGQGRLPAGFGVASVAITPTGDRCAASTGDGSVSLFDVATGKKVKELLGRSRVGLNLTFSPDGKSLASAASDGAVQVWEVESGKSLGVAPPPVAQDYLTVASIVFTGSGKAVALAQLNSTAVVWEVPSGKVITPVVGHQHPITGLVFTAEKELISAAFNGEVIRWDAAGKRVGNVPLTLPGARIHPFVPARVSAPPGGGVLVRNDGNSSLGVFDPVSGVQRFSLSTPYGGEPPVSFSADGKRMLVGVSGGYGKQAKGRLALIDAGNGTKAADVVVGPGAVLGVALTGDGKTAGVFRTVTDDKGVTKTLFNGIDLEGGKQLSEAEFKGYNFVRMAACPDGKSVLATAPDTSHLTKYDLATGKGEPFAGGKVLSSFGPVFSPDGKRVAVSADTYGGPPQISVFDFEGGKKTHTFQGHLRGVSAMAFSADGKTLATGSHDTTVLLWDLTKEQ
jgi:WD40 repeat protein